MQNKATWHTRRIAVAYLYDQFDIPDDLGVKLYTRANQELTTDHRMTGLENPAGTVRMRREFPGPRPSIFQITLDQFKGTSRFLIESNFPCLPNEILKQSFDLSFKAFSGTVQSRNLKQVEVCYRCSFRSPSGDSARFMADRMTRVPFGGSNILGRQVSHQGVILGLVPGIGDMPLSGAGLRIMTEPLVEDPSQVYLEVNSIWQRLQLNLPAEVPESVRQQVPSEMNRDERLPYDYIDPVVEFTHGRLYRFLSGQEDTP